MEDILKFKLLDLKSIELSIQQLLTVLGVITIFYIWIRLLKKAIYGKRKLDISTQFALFTTLRYISIVITFYIILKILNVNLNIIFASSAAILVGLSLGLQHLIYDFFSGLIILLDGSIKVGNIIEFNGKRVQVRKINFRTSIVETREEKEVIVPNSILTKSEIINWSNQNSQIRQNIEINIKPEDFDKVSQLIIKVLEDHEKVLNDPKPYVRLENFNDFSLNIKILFWSNELLAVGRLLGEIRLNIFKEMQANDIVLPSPYYYINIKNNQ